MNSQAEPKILIVDDQPRNLDALEAMLGGSGCRIVRADSPDEALLRVLRDDFAAIVLDIRMPGMSGIELAKLIKQRRRSQHVPILFLTAHLADDDDVLKGYDAGAVDYLSKPVNAQILRSKVAVFVDTFRKTIALAELNEALEREVRERQKAQAELEAANRDLERRVDERTAALVRAHRGVRENEERLRMAMEVAQIAAWEWNLSTGQMTWSTDPETMFGFPAGALGDELRMFRVLHPDDRHHAEAALAQALKSGIYEAQFRAVRPDGTVLWITERGQVVSDPEADRMVGISRDVTAERSAEQERERLLRSEAAARAEAEHQSRLKDEFLATLSHELRTPMNAILGWLSILETGKPIREVHAALAVIQRNAQLQAKLIEDLLDMTRLISGNITLDVTQVDLAAIAHATMQGLQPTAQSKSVNLLAVVDTPVARVPADARRIQQVLWNVVHNAIKFTPNGGRVELRIQANDESVQLAVQDTGKGISSSFLPFVFERFRQEDSSAKREFFGLGLGLAIAKQLVDLHGGKIGAASGGQGCGATFTIELPYRASGAARADSDRQIGVSA